MVNRLILLKFPVQIPIPILNQVMSHTLLSNSTVIHHQGYISKDKRIPILKLTLNQAHNMAIIYHLVNNLFAVLINYLYFVTLLLSCNYYYLNLSSFTNLLMGNSNKNVFSIILINNKTRT
jgi:cation transporter-like permease